jgi:hypothetical protein
MEDNFDFQAHEKKAGSAAARSLAASLKSEINSVFKRRSGTMAKSGVTARYKEGRLDRLVLNSPHYSFKQHFGSSKTGVTDVTLRKVTSVSSFSRQIEGKIQTVAAHTRSGGSVARHNKNINYKSTDHIAKALNRTNALQTLATELAENRMVEITSQISF